MLTKRHERLRELAELRRRKILDALATGEKTAKQLAAELDVKPHTLNTQLLDLRKPGMSLIFVARYIQSEKSGSAAPVYAIGNRPDAPKPKMQSAIVADTEKLMKREAEAILSRIKPPPAANDPLLAWIPRRANGA